MTTKETNRKAKKVCRVCSVTLTDRNRYQQPALICRSCDDARRREALAQEDPEALRAKWRTWKQQQRDRAKAEKEAGDR